MRVWNYGGIDSINTDMLFPGKYTYTCSTAEEVIPHLLEDLDPGFAASVREGDVVLGGRNFGCGSSREQPVLGLKAVGVRAVIARSFARIFYRAAINQGLLLIECPDAVENYQENQPVIIDPEAGILQIGDSRYRFPGLPAEIMAIMDAGGLLNFTREQLASKK